MNINATMIGLYHICKRELWLHANGIRFEHTSDLVTEGKLIHEKSYPLRPGRYEEVEIDGIKVDFYDARNRVIHELKKSNKIEVAHEWQLKYYLYVFRQNGIADCTGILEYPTLRQTKAVSLCDEDIQEIQQMICEIQDLIQAETCPSIKKRSFCRSCSYFDFCYSEETDG